MIVNVFESSNTSSSKDKKQLNRLETEHVLDEKIKQVCTIVSLMIKSICSLSDHQLLVSHDVWLQTILSAGSSFKFAAAYTVSFVNSATLFP